MPVSFPVKAFCLCVSAAPDSLAWAWCFRRAMCQNSRGVASDCPCQASALPVPTKAGKTHRQECHARGNQGRVRVKVPLVAAVNELWLQMPPLHAPGFWAQEGHSTASATTYFTCTRHTSGLRPPDLPKLLESEKRGQAPTAVHNLHPDPSVFPIVYQAVRVQILTPPLTSCVNAA